MRPVPILLAALGAAPLALFGLEWAGVTELSWLRFQRPLLSFVTAPLALFLAYRLGALPGRMTALRRSAWSSSSPSIAAAASISFPTRPVGSPPS
jgi:hypothetical protein